MSRFSKYSSIYALAVAAVFSAGAQASVVITFDALASPSQQDPVSYTESGFSFTTTAPSFLSWGSSQSSYTGSQALANGFANGVTVLAKVGGGAFSFDEIDLSEAFNQQSYSATNVTFIGTLSGGGTASFSVDLDLVFGNQNVDFGNTFSNVTSVSWTQTFNYHQFDNLVLNSGNSVPEPTSLALVGLALAGLGVRRARRG